MAQGAGTVDSSFGAMFDRNVMLSLSKVDAVTLQIGNQAQQWLGQTPGGGRGSTYTGVLLEEDIVF